MTESLKRIVIVGGGTAGWMTAAKLSQVLTHLPVEIELVESPDVSTVGVGEATIPTIRRFYHGLGLGHKDVIEACQATVKLGIKFQDWSEVGESFIHPFGLYGQSANGIGFHHYWLKLRQQGYDKPFSDFCLASVLAENNKFFLPPVNPTSPLSVFDWALHIDAAKFAVLMANYAKDNGVIHTQATIEQVMLCKKSGDIDFLALSEDRKVDGDLYIDCSGFRALLLQQALNTGYESWSHWLLCDRAFAVQSKRSDSTTPVTTLSKAQSAGWQWKIPLQQRQGNGYVYSSQFVSDDNACKTLLDSINEELTTDVKSFSFTPGRSRLAWNKNCIGVGLSSGFLEPLESTSIALIETAVERVGILLKKGTYSMKDVNAFNEVSILEYERVRDFIIYHYKASGRSDTRFWKTVRGLDIPESLKTKVEAYKKNGELTRGKWEIFHPDSWLAIYNGFGVWPETYNPRVNRLDEHYLKTSLDAMHDSIVKASDCAMTHDEFLSNLLERNGNV